MFSAEITMPHIDFKYQLHRIFSCPSWHWHCAIMTWRIADYLEFED